MARKSIFVLLTLVSALVASSAASAQLTVNNPLQIIDQAAIKAELETRGFNFDPGNVNLDYTGPEAEALGDILEGIRASDIVVGDDLTLTAGGSPIWRVPDLSTVMSANVPITPDALGVERFRVLADQISTVSFSSDLSIARSLQDSGIAIAPDLLTEWSLSSLDVGNLPEYQENLAAISQDPSAFLDALRMSNGEPVVGEDHYRDTVLLIGTKPNGRLETCSGVAVAPRLVITAAHCVCIMTVERVVVGLAYQDPNAVKIPVASTDPFIPCATFQSADAFGRDIGTGDIAVVNLTDDLPEIQFRKLASAQTLNFVKSIRAVGFGVSNVAGGVIYLMRGKYTAEIIIASKDCSDVATMFPNPSYRCQATHEMVAGGASDTCKGDSGGPAYVFGLDDHSYIGGITSRSVDPLGSCGSGGIYVKVSFANFRSWLQERGVPAESWAD